MTQPRPLTATLTFLMAVGVGEGRQPLLPPAGPAPDSTRFPCRHGHRLTPRRSHPGRLRHRSRPRCTARGPDAPAPGSPRCSRRRGDHGTRGSHHVLCRLRGDLSSHWAHVGGHADDHPLRGRPRRPRDARSHHRARDVGPALGNPALAHGLGSPRPGRRLALHLLGRGGSGDHGPRLASGPTRRGTAGASPTPKR